MANILVTGATGKIGSAVVSELHTANASFAVMSRNPEAAPSFRDRGIEFRIGDFRDPLSLRKAIGEAETLFLLAPPDPLMSSWEKNALDAALAGNVEQVVYLSALGAQIDSHVTIGREHAKTEDYLEQTGLDYTILRPHSFMQNILGSLPSIQAEGRIYSSLVDGKVPLIDARDIGAAAAKIMLEGGHAGRVYQLTGPEAISYHDIAEVLSEKLERDIEYIAVPDTVAKKGMVDSGIPEWLSDDLVALTRIWREGMGTRVEPDLEQVLERKPRSFRDFVQDHLSYFQA